MPEVTREVRINAPPEMVFDLVSDVEHFNRYSSYIRSIEKRPDGSYRWRVEILGVGISWDAVVVESARPVRFAWRSTKGVRNAGAYELEPADGATLVRFTMDYGVTGTVLDDLVAPLLNRVMSSVSNELIDNIKRRIEG